jgi:hypothetical protein
VIFFNLNDSTIIVINNKTIEHYYNKTIMLTFAAILELNKTYINMNKKLLVFSLFILIFVACKDGIENISEGNALIENKLTGENQDLIRNEITADGDIDTTNAPRIVFETPIYDFGTIKQGELVDFTFKFKNTGLSPLVIKGAKATCGCTVPKPNKEPILPGETGEIPVTFNSSGKSDNITKTITVTTNAYPNRTQVKLVGFVQVEE